MPDVVSYDLVDALQRSGCPLCGALAEYERRAARSFEREGRLADGARRAFLDAGGYCRRHAALLRAAIADARTAVAAVDLYGELAVRDAALLRGVLAARRRASLRRRGACPACADSAAAAERKAAFLVDALTEEPVRAAYRRSDGLCVPHLLAAVEAALRADRAIARFLVEDGCRRLDGLGAQLREYDRKRDHRHAHEPKGDEQLAWLEAIRRYAGDATA